MAAGTSSPSDALKGICNGRCVVAFVAFCMTAGFRRTVFPRCIFLPDGKGSVGLRDQSAVVEDPEPPELMDPEEVKKRFFFFSVGRNGGVFFCFG